MFFRVKDCPDTLSQDFLPLDAENSFSPLVPIIDCPLFVDSKKSVTYTFQNVAFFPKRILQVQHIFPLFNGRGEFGSQCFKERYLILPPFTLLLAVIKTDKPIKIAFEKNRQ